MSILRPVAPEKIREIDVMARPASEHPTELELLILKILWERSPLPVREVRLALAAAGREAAHTSVITTLNTMVRKKLLRRRRDGKAFLFSPRVEQQTVRQRMLGDVVDRLFDGSAAAVMLSLLDRADLKPDDLKQLRQFVDRQTREKRE
jgi:BlaI family transcriptional regulator, penicillinase repressor